MRLAHQNAIFHQVSENIRYWEVVYCARIVKLIPTINTRRRRNEETNKNTVEVLELDGIILYFRGCMAKKEIIMCDISKETRRERYKIIRDKGYSRGWAQRARDFSEIRFIRALEVK